MKNQIKYFLIGIFSLMVFSGCGVAFDIGFENTKIETTKIIEENYENNVDVKEIEMLLNYFIENLHIIEKENAVEVISAFENNSDLVMQHIYLAKETGEFYIYPFAEIPGDYDARTRPWYIQAMKDEIYISEVYEDITSGERIITVAKRIDISDKQYGVIGIDVVVERN